MNRAFILSLLLAQGNSENQQLSKYHVNWENQSVKEDFNDAYRGLNSLYCVLKYFRLPLFFFICEK